MAYIYACSDGFARMDRAMNPKKPLAIPLARRGPGGRYEKVKPEFTVNPGFCFPFRIFRRLALGAKPIAIPPCIFSFTSSASAYSSRGFGR